MFLKFIHSEKATKFCEIFILLLTGTKAELLQEAIFSSSIVLVMKKLEIEKTKPTFIMSVLKVEY